MLQPPLPLQAYSQDLRHHVDMQGTQAAVACNESRQALVPRCPAPMQAHALVHHHHTLHHGTIASANSLGRDRATTKSRALPTDYPLVLSRASSHSHVHVLYRTVLYFRLRTSFRSATVQMDSILVTCNPGGCTHDMKQTTGHSAPPLLPPRVNAIPINCQTAKSLCNVPWRTNMKTDIQNGILPSRHAAKQGTRQGLVISLAHAQAPNMHCCFFCTTSTLHMCRNVWYGTHQREGQDKMPAGVPLSDCAHSKTLNCSHVQATTSLTTHRQQHVMYLPPQSLRLLVLACICNYSPTVTSNGR